LAGLIGRSFAERVVIAVGSLLPVGLALGMAMPIGLAQLVKTDPEAVPYAWGVNGLASIVGAVLAVFVALNFGFRIAGTVAAACYLAALGLRSSLFTSRSARSLEVGEPGQSSG
jgi:predicted MFS family arabinose efflux permease